MVFVVIVITYVVSLCNNWRDRKNKQGKMKNGRVHHDCELAASFPNNNYD